VTIRQVRLEATLNPSSRSPSPRPVTHADEQRALRDETIAIFHSAVDPAVGAESGDDSDNILVPREKSKDELEREDEEYRAFLQREVGDELPSLITVEKGMVSLTDVEGPKKTKRKREKGAENRAAEGETDQEFLMKFVKFSLHVFDISDLQPQLCPKPRLDRSICSTGPDVQGSHKY
jgi:protein KRI1